MNLEQKKRRLKETLRGYDSTLIAFSGGADSAYLAYMANEILGDRALSITADSPSLASFQRADALNFARKYNLRHEVILTEEMQNPAYIANPTNRCFFCKDELFQKLSLLATQRGFRTVVYGVNMDDLSDYRPGQMAAKKFAVRAPLVEAELSKAEIRTLSKEAGLDTWDHPASACLSSRIPYGMMVTVDKLRTIDRGEQALHDLGFRQVRVRHHGEIVRIEISPEEMAHALQPEVARQFSQIFKNLGFKYVTLDLDGYRQGSMNEVQVK